MLTSQIEAFCAVFE